jgi:hypothetical protein
MSSISSLNNGPATLPTFKVASDQTPSALPAGNTDHISNAASDAPASSGPPTGRATQAASAPDDSSPVSKQADAQDQQTNQQPSVPPASSGKVVNLLV